MPKRAMGFRSVELKTASKKPPFAMIPARANAGMSRVYSQTQKRHNILLASTVVVPLRVEDVAFGACPVTEILSAPVLLTVLNLLPIAPSFSAIRVSPVVKLDNLDPPRSNERVATVRLLLHVPPPSIAGTVLLRGYRRWPS